MKDYLQPIEDLGREIAEYIKFMFKKVKPVREMEEIIYFGTIIFRCDTTRSKAR